MPSDSEVTQPAQFREAVHHLRTVLSNGHGYGVYKKWAETGDDASADKLTEIDHAWADAQMFLATLLPEGEHQ